MSSALLKGGIASVGVGSAGLGGWAISSHLNNTVASVLSSKGYKLTSSLKESEQDAAWKKVTRTYQLEVRGDLKIKEGVVTDVDLKNWCSQNMKVQSNDALLRKASKWCVIYSSFEDKLKEEGVELEADTNSLKNRYSDLRELTNEVSKITPDSGTGDENGRKLKKWCEKMVHLSYSDDSVYQTFKKHCVKATTPVAGASG
ncbi:hypothetical protein HF1_05500 [Mycoplasma haemofelis str. Langford 1]|uniref:Uncharacterized protein n=1 Tax=Mycoplasma haemofelis (strain Langford 1) TaxID=941640 RepID=E8ZHD7_MYCHL|nr:hypothetical protein [Mycoplasma haemofelis]CBY92558.1 hypothetical protein HF1_05500 [Mycoplasma haemofelis str. Langford 1]